MMTRMGVGFGVWFAIAPGVMLWGSLHGKRLVRDWMLRRIPWRGDERVLDVGCGRGLMMIGAAERLTTGRAVGGHRGCTRDALCRCVVRRDPLDVHDPQHLRPGR